MKLRTQPFLMSIQGLCVEIRRLAFTQIFTELPTAYTICAEPWGRLKSLDSKMNLLKRNNTTSKHILPESSEKCNNKSPEGALKPGVGGGEG